jgi:hypothetical protein
MDEDTPTTNPELSEGRPNPAFTEPSGPPPERAQSDARIRLLEQRLEEAYERIERGSRMLERAVEYRR